MLNKIISECRGFVALNLPNEPMILLTSKTFKEVAGESADIPNSDFKLVGFSARIVDELEDDYEIVMK